MRYQSDFKVTPNLSKPPIKSNSKAKFLKLLRGFRNIGPYIRVIFKMMVDIIQFMSILSLFVIGFSQSFFTLLYNIKEFKNPAESFVSTFDIILGGLDGQITKHPQKDLQMFK